MSRESRDQCLFRALDFLLVILYSAIMPSYERANSGRGKKCGRGDCRSDDNDFICG
jgi:hypothetical protein